MFIDSTPADSTVNRNMQRDYAHCLKRTPKITARMSGHLDIITLYIVVRYCVQFRYRTIRLNAAKVCCFAAILKNNG